MPSLPPARATVRVRGVVRSRPFTTPRAPLSLPLLRRPHLYLFIHHPRPLWILCSFSSDNLCIMPSIDCIAYYLPPSVCCIITFLYLSVAPLSPYPYPYPYPYPMHHALSVPARERARRRHAGSRAAPPGLPPQGPSIHGRSPAHTRPQRPSTSTARSGRAAVTGSPRRCAHRQRKGNGPRPSPARPRASALHICCAPPGVLSELACLRPCVESVPGALARRGRASPQAFYRPCSAYTHPPSRRTARARVRAASLRAQPHAGPLTSARRRQCVHRGGAPPLLPRAGQNDPGPAN